MNTPSMDEIRHQILGNMLNADPAQAVHERSDNYIRATGNASAIEGLYEVAKRILAQIFPDTCDLNWLREHARRRGITQRSAVVSTGTIQLKGAAGTVWSSGSVGNDVSSVQYRLTQTVTVPVGGVVTATAEAVIPGLAGNRPNNTPLTMVSPPFGGDASATLLTMDSGDDDESPESLLARLLDVIRRPPAGGNKYDYVRWAKEVSGVRNAYCYPLRRGNGKVDVAITSSTGMPSAQLLAAVSAHIEDVRPVRAKEVAVLAPDALNFNLAGSLMVGAGYTFAAVSAAAEANIRDYISKLAPGEVAYLHKIRSLISDTPGVVDYSITTPTTNLVPTINASLLEWVRLVNVVFTP